MEGGEIGDFGNSVISFVGEESSIGIVFVIVCFLLVMEICVLEVMKNIGNVIYRSVWVWMLVFLKLKF